MTDKSPTNEIGKVVSADGDFGTVDTVVITDGTAEVYNLTVDEAHTYFVGDGAWLVHNNCPPANNSNPNPVWVPSPKKGFNELDNANYHWTKHGQEFPEYNNATEYIQGAHDFINNPPSTTLIRVGASGDTIMYDPPTNRLMIYRTADKTPITYHKPSHSTEQDRMNYFLSRN
ncbi:MAG TPA: hypothetical protein PLZ51_14655 [Aggregatilineales bacterium]|nr:hypothetical protein [Aggregatilineales bacterium]